jgi:hypothetical protein
VIAELNDESLIECDAPSDRRLDKAVPGAKWSASRKVWLMPLSWATCTVSRSVLGAELEIGPRLTAWAREEYESRVLPASVAREAEDGPEFVPAEPGDPADVVDRLDGEVPGNGVAYTSEDEARAAWWSELWIGMPEFLHRDLSAKRTLQINFRDPKDVEEFARLIGQRIGPRERSIWFPEAPIERETDWLWADEEDHSVPPLLPGQAQRLKREQGEAAVKSVKRARKAATETGTDPLAQVLGNLV